MLPMRKRGKNTVLYKYTLIKLKEIAETCINKRKYIRGV